jgi:hypothetical protein
MGQATKLTLFLRTHGFLALEYFTQDSLVLFIKIIHTESGHLFFLSIPSKLSLHVDPDTNVFSIRPYTRTQGDHPIVSTEYQPLAEHSPSHSTRPVSEQLEEGYQQPIHLSDLTTEERAVVDVLKRQLLRLRHCFKRIRYSLVVTYSNCLVYLRDQQKLDVYLVHGYEKNKQKAWYTITDLETFYSKIATFGDHLLRIHTEFEALLDLNQRKHIEFLRKRYVDAFIERSTEITRIKTTLKEQQFAVRKVLTKLQGQENALLDERDRVGNLQDSESAHRRSFLSERADKVHRLKLDVLQALTLLDRRIKNLYLEADSIGFDLSRSLNEIQTLMTNEL